MSTRTPASTACSGSEDAEQIVPAIEAARAAGIDATGPHPADTVFHQAVHRKRFDAIVCMYHDQGHTPMKLLAFESGVNVTVGLPIVRTSVDHGTAFDIAWQGIAFTGSLDHALRLGAAVDRRGTSVSEGRRDRGTATACPRPRRSARDRMSATRSGDDVTCWVPACTSRNIR